MKLLACLMAYRRQRSRRRNRKILKRAFRIMIRHSRPTLCFSPNYVQRLLMMPILVKILGELPLIHPDHHREPVRVMHLIYHRPHHALRLSTVHHHYLIHVRLFLFQISSL